MGSDLYIAAYNTSAVYRLQFDANGDISSSAQVALAPGAISLAFSPDGQEMFVSSHFDGHIYRFLQNGGSWSPNGSINAGTVLGEIHVVPEPATWIVLSGMTAIAVLCRRRR